MTAWTLPHAWVSGETITRALLQALSDDTAHLKERGDELMTLPSGTAATAGDLVVGVAGSANVIARTASAGQAGPIGVSLNGHAAAGVADYVRWGGIAPVVNTASSVNARDLLRPSATAGLAETTTGNDYCAVALTSCVGAGQVVVLLMPRRAGGTVTSVGLTVPGEFTVGGSPVTGSGTLAIAKANQVANQLYAGPIAGGAAAPGFRALDRADLPTPSFCVGQNTAAQALGNNTETTILLPGEPAGLDPDSGHFLSDAACTGTVAKASGSSVLTGTGTLFTTELAVGQVIDVPGGATERRVVTAIASDTSLTVNGTYANTSTGQTATRFSGAGVCRVAGVYAVWARTTFAVDATGVRYVNLYRRNGTGTFASLGVAGQPAPAGISPGITVLPQLLTLAQWDWLEMTAYHNITGGSSLNTTSAAGNSFIALLRVSA